MKYFFFPFLLICLGTSSYAQTKQDSLPSVLNPEKIAEFKGGVNGWTDFLQRTLNPSLLSAAGAPAGAYRTIANFLVDSLGNVSDIRIEVNPGYGAAEEFIRVLKLSNKKWVPAYDHSKRVAYRHKQSLTLLSN
ncbi:MAG: hypothetical protein V4450_07730 [Bacteroidota bacterium]